MGGNGMRNSVKSNNKNEIKKSSAPQGLLQALYLRETRGCLQKHQRSKPTKLYKRLPGRLISTITDLASESVLLAGYIFLGFSKDGNFLFSYTQTVDPIAVIPCFQYVYRLQWWHFRPRKRLRLVSEVRLFAEYQINEHLHMKVCYWPTDESMILIYGCSSISRVDEQQAQQCFITITATPSIGHCEECEIDKKRLYDQDYAVHYDTTAPQTGCLAHSFTLHTHYNLVPPYPCFNPCISLKVDRKVIINTGDSIIALSVDLQNLGNRIQRPEEDASSSFCGSMGPAEIGDFLMPSLDTETEEDEWSEPPPKSLVKKQVDEKWEAFLVSNRVPKVAQTKESYDQDKRVASPIAHLAAMKIEEEEVQKDIQEGDQVSPDHRKVRRRSQEENDLDFIPPNKKCRIDSDNNVPFSCELSFDSQGSKVIVTSPKSGTRAPPSIHQTERKSSLELDENFHAKSRDDYRFLDEDSGGKVIGGQDSSPKSRDDNSLVSHIKKWDETHKEKENISPDKNTHTPLRREIFEKNVHIDVVDNKGFLTYLEVMSKRSGDLALLSPPVLPSTSTIGAEDGTGLSTGCAFSLSRVYAEIAGREDDDDEEETGNASYSSSLPLEIYGSAYMRMQLVSCNDEETVVQECPNVVVQQSTFDIEQYIHEISHRLCAQSNKKYLAFTDYDIQIIDVVPDTGDVLVLARVLVQATVKNKGLAKNLRNYSGIERKTYQTGFKFVWNVKNGKYMTVDLEDLNELDNSKWNPAAQVAKLQRQWYVPTSPYREVRVMDNEPVFTGEPKQVLLDPHNYIAITLPEL